MKPSVNIKNGDHDYYHLKDDWNDVGEQLETLCDSYELPSYSREQ